jgi:hypothetical protein
VGGGAFSASYLDSVKQMKLAKYGENVQNVNTKKLKLFSIINI